MNKTIENLRLEKLALDKQASALDVKIKSYQDEYQKQSEEKKMKDNAEKFQADIAYYLDVCEKWNLRPNFRTGFTYGGPENQIGIIQNKSGYICVGVICDNIIRIDGNSSKFKLSDGLPDLSVNPILKLIISKWDSIAETIEKSLTDRIHESLEKTRQQVKEKKEICDLFENDKNEDALELLKKTDLFEEQPAKDEYTDVEEKREYTSEELHNNFLTLLKEAREKSQKANQKKAENKASNGDNSDGYTLDEIVSQVLGEDAKATADTINQMLDMLF